MLTVTKLRLIVVLIGMLTLPGWAVLAFGNIWRQWKGLQRWIVAVGISIAFYPALFYSIRFALPFLTLGPYKMGTLLLACIAVLAWRMRGQWRELCAFDWLEWVAVGVFGMTLFTRFWIIRDHPYPAWSDSLHHTLLTELTAVQGKLPINMEPYFPVPLGKYHLGLYAISATVQWLAQVPAHTALLWTAQMLNGLCGAGVYLVLDRKVGRVGAIVGAVVVGLLSHQPAIYVNWGRFTQIASQAILLIAWLMTWEAIALWKRPWQEYRAKILWNTVCAAVLTGAVFQLHFQVAAFYIPLLIISVVWELWKARRENRVGSMILGTVVVGTVVLIIIAPDLWKALHVHVTTVLNRFNQTVATTGKVSHMAQTYYDFPLHTVPMLVARPWLIILASLGAVVGLLTRNKTIFTCLVWIVSLCLIGNTHLLGLPLTNLGAVMVMLYLPIGLIVGSATEEILAFSGPLYRERTVQLVTTFVLIAGFVASHIRVIEIEPYRYFVTPEDVTAMEWIKKNTPADALFAVNTHFWLPNVPHGTDAGYWIPYFTGRQTTVGVMLAFVEATEYRACLVQMSRAVEQLEVDNASLPELQSLGVDYIYIGRMGDFSGPGLNVARLSQAENVALLYQNTGVSILQIRPAN
jgi:hypothetical protein